MPRRTIPESSDLIELLNIQQNNIVFLFDSENVIDYVYNNKFDIFCMELLYFLGKVNKMDRKKDIILIFTCKYIKGGCNMEKILNVRNTFELIFNIKNINFIILRSTLPENIGEMIKKPKKISNITLTDESLYNYLDIGYANHFVRTPKANPKYKKIINDNTKLNHSIRQHDDLILLLLAKQLTGQNIFTIVFSDDKFDTTEILSLYYKLPIDLINNTSITPININFNYNDFNSWYHSVGYNTVTESKYNHPQDPLNRKKLYSHFKKLLTIQEITPINPMISTLHDTVNPLRISPERKIQMQEFDLEKRTKDIEKLRLKIKEIKERLTKVNFDSSELKYLKYKLKYLSLKLIH